MNDELIVQVEQGLLGSLMRNNANIVRVIEGGLIATNFSIFEHQCLYGRMSELFSEQQSFSLGEMSTVLGNFPGGADACSYVRDLIDGYPSASADQAASYTRDIKEYSKKRDIRAALKEVEDILPTRSSEEILEFVSDIVAEKMHSRHQKSGQQVHEEILSDLENPPEKYPTGLLSLDKKMAGGLQSGRTYGFAGKEKTGKTALAGTISYNLNAAECSHMYVALEMGSKEIEERNLARRVGENSLLFKNPNPAFMQKVARVAPSKFIQYFDSPGGLLQEILLEVGIAKIKHGIKGFILDYWQLVEGRERGQTEEQHIRFVAQRCADYAKKHGLWCIILAQLNNDGKLFGGGGLKKACDQLYFIERCSDDETDPHRWMRMEASRYTPKLNIGSPQNPSLVLNAEIGPYFEEA